MGSKEFVVSVNNVSKSFEVPHTRRHTIKSNFLNLFRKGDGKQTRVALKNIDFHIKEGEFFGIVGRNGSGKSTILKMIAGIYQPTKGSISVRGKLVPFIELGVGFNPELSGRENVYLNGVILGFSRKEIDDRYEKIVAFAELEDFMDEKLKNYSSGMQVRLAFSCATMAKADVLLVDEVLAVGDADFQRKCFNYFRQLKKNKKTVIFVSHDMNAVREYCDRAVLIENGDIIEEGDSESIAKKYTKLFIEEQPNQIISNDGKRYGDNEVIVSNLKIQNKLFKSGEDKVIPIEVTIKAKVDSQNLAVGFLVKNSSGEGVIGTNTAIENTKIPKLSKGKEAVVKWEIPNLFGAGNYKIDVAVTSTDGTLNHDWWEECLAFRVHKERSSPYVVSPEIPTKITYKQ